MPAKKYFTEEERRAAQLAAIKRYQERNRERLRALKRAYYERNKAKINAKAREKKAADFPKADIYRLSGDIPDFNLRFWPELKGIDFNGFKALMLAEPKRQYYAFEDLPALDSGHRAEFYEPKTEGFMLRTGYRTEK